MTYVLRHAFRKFPTSTVYLQQDADSPSCGHVTMGEIRRHFSPGCWVFLTLVCAGRSPFLRSESAKFRLLSLFRELRNESGFQLYAWVVLDDHLHLLVSDPQGTTSRWVQKFKLRFVRSDPSLPKKIWQKRFWDHLIRDEVDLHRHLDYIHHNPVKHGLVVRSAEYPWSSFMSFVRRGWYAVDWQAVVELDECVGSE